MKIFFHAWWLLGFPFLIESQSAKARRAIKKKQAKKDRRKLHRAATAAESEAGRRHEYAVVERMDRTSD